MNIKPGDPVMLRTLSAYPCTVLRTRGTGATKEVEVQSRTLETAWALEAQCTLAPRSGPSTPTPYSFKASVPGSN